jgi:Protein of unknown function (DUF3073)
MRRERTQRDLIDVVIRPANRVRLYLYGSWRAPRSPRGIYGGSVCVTDVPYAGQRQRHRGAARLRTFEGVEPMGRGRAKAKQVKVARQLKYNGGGTDLDRLRQELGVGTEARSADHDDPYAEYDDEDEDEDGLDDDNGEEDDEDDWSPSH